MYLERADANTKELVEAWRVLGCTWVAMDRFAGFDGLLIARNGLHIVEIKNLEGRNRLTPAEIKRQGQVEALGQKYNIIRTPLEAVALAGFSWERYMELKNQ